MHCWWRYCWSLILLPGLLTGLSSHAQSTLIPRKEPRASEYVLGPGDQITIHVVDLDDIPATPIRISTDGFVDLPLVGRIKASGLTLQEFREDLRPRVNRYVSDPNIAVNLVENQSRTVSIVGSVNSPGVRSLNGPARLLDVISMAGGVTKDAGFRVIVTRQPQWGEIPLPDSKSDADGVHTATVLLDGLLSSAKPQENIYVNPGDVISIPRAEIVYVLGTVKKAGGFPLASQRSVGLLHTLSLAEGFDRDAAPGKARILRPPPGGEGPIKTIPVNISRILSGKDPDVPLFANDVLYVPNSLVKLTARRSAEAVLQVATGVAIYR